MKGSVRQGAANVKKSLERHLTKTPYREVLTN